MAPNAAGPSRTRLLYPLALAAILLLAAFLRFYRLDASSLWSDEGNTWAMLGRSWGEIAAAAAADIHPPGYYWLLKAWSLLFGTSAWAMRSFSAVLGVLLVLLVERIGRRIGGRQVALLAALLAAVNPLLVYYSQEARMYTLLALVSAGVMWALLGIGGFREDPLPGRPPSGKTPFREAFFLLCATLGLWTHYSFAIVLAAANLAWLGRWLWLRARRSPLATTRRLWSWIGLNALPLLLFAPWLPTAADSVLHWPKGGVEVGLGEGMVLTLRTLLFGPLHTTPQPAWPWLLAGAALPLMGLAALILARPHVGVRATREANTPSPAHPLTISAATPARYALPLALWLGLPIALMAGLGLFTDAFLKFLITAAPAWALLVACVSLGGRQRVVRGILAAGVAIFAVALALVTLPAYYRDANARDNYAGVAAYLATVGNPQTDLVILDAPGQGEVWRYYDPGLQVLALPAARPADPADVEAALAAAVDPAGGTRQVYALFWAVDEADPQRVVEGWLDRHAFKALDTWQGNLRLAVYSVAGGLQPLPFDPVGLGDSIVLAGQAQPQSEPQQAGQPQQVAGGEAALVQLRWQVLQDVHRRYKVSVQLIDAAGQVVAQRDSEPVGGSRPTDGWRAGEEIVDNYALPLPPGAPPGDYRLVAVMYDAETGERLPRAGSPNGGAGSTGDVIELGRVAVDRPVSPFPAALIPMQTRIDRRLGPVTLLGYDLYRKDFAHAPQTPLRPGDTLHAVLYWQAPDPLPAGWPADLSATLRLGDQAVSAPLGGPAFPTAQWQGGDLVRGQMDIVYDGAGRTPVIEVAGERMKLDAGGILTAD